MSDIERKLTAILAADVAGYSAMMERDEEGTLETLRAHRKTMSGFIERHRGRIANTAGDSVMAEFPSVLEAVTAAVEIQQELGVRNAELEPDKQMLFRIGINLGDVMVEGDDLFGEGVNIAARLEALADPGGIYISGTVYDQVKNKLTLGYDFLGEHRVKNISNEVRMYRVETGAETPDDPEGVPEPPEPPPPPASDGEGSNLSATLGGLGERIGKVLDERVDSDEIAERIKKKVESGDLDEAIARRVKTSSDLKDADVSVQVDRSRLIPSLATIIIVLLVIDAANGGGWWVQYPAIVAGVLIGLSLVKGVWGLAVIAAGVAAWDFAGGDGWWSQWVWIGAAGVIALRYVARINKR